MASLIGQVKTILDELGFESQETSFEKIVTNGELTILGELRILPDCDSSRILSCFPKLYVFHRTASPEKGSFFIEISEEPKGIDPIRDHIYERYFPKAVLIIKSDPEGSGLLARWHHKKDKWFDLRSFLKSVIR